MEQKKARLSTYHGRVDVHRGVMSLPMILAGLHSQGVDAELHIHGNGDAISPFTEYRNGRAHGNSKRCLRMN